ncbi:hypothetical protein ABG79_01498 [Caloramator mitchellensis]|uniref:MetS family NSS transporter small subunit n=1 Tax=Caloramator mitchellensis TaxID=908809 RepID=A0A0R3JUM6_CALMK|nr:hypothetical protein ABG79_01498 [Caloramator mitchellensis]
MSGGALTFMVLAWGVILAAVAVTLSSLLKHSK